MGSLPFGQSTQLVLQMHSTCALARIYNQPMNAANANTIDYDCGIAMARITHWLDLELGLPNEGDC